MKKLTLIAMAALLLVCTQCKKNETTDAKIIQITFTPTDNGAKTGFNPDGTFSWSENECIFVGGPDGCIGTLTGTAIDGNITFTGDITVPNHGDMLHFFYLGNNKDGSVIPTELDFSAQNGQDVTNFHVACCSQEYITGNTDFGGTLDVLVSFAYIDLSAFVDANGAQEVVYLHGADVFSKATVNYSEGTITGTNGYISLGRAINGGGYYALIPQTTPSSTTVKFDSNTKTGTMNFLRGIETAKLYRHSDQSALAPEMGELRANAGGLFSVSDTKMVRIAQSNLQYTRTSTTQSWANGTWSFMEHPWSYVEYIPADNTTWTVSEEYENETAIGLFGWGTSGKGNMSDYGAYYYPWATAVNTTQEGGLYYGPKNRDKNLTDEYANGDWGIYNNPGGELPSWRVLTKDEWLYLFGMTANNQEITTHPRYQKYGRGKVSIGEQNGGIIIVPDDFNDPNTNIVGDGAFVGGLGTTWYGTNTASNYYNNNQFRWDKMVNAGVVFLPISGYRDGNVIKNWHNTGYYQTSTSESVYRAHQMKFTGTEIDPANDTYTKCEGLSVRLVMDLD